MAHLSCVLRSVASLILFVEPALTNQPIVLSLSLFLFSLSLSRCLVRPGTRHEDAKKRREHIMTEALAAKANPPSKTRKNNTIFTSRATSRRTFQLLNGTSNNILSNSSNSCRGNILASGSGGPTAPATARLSLRLDPLKEISAASSSSTSDAAQRAPDLAEAFLRCQQRLNIAHEKELEQKRHSKQQQQQVIARNEQMASTAPQQAAQRLSNRKKKHNQMLQQDIEFLITQQESSVDAMNIARMLSPRFEEKIKFTPSIARHSTDEERVRKLLESTRIGSYYQ